jgi:hypothetical protein
MILNEAILKSLEDINGLAYYKSVYKHIVDNNYYDFGVYKELQDINYFKQVTVSGGTVTWVNEQDICPDTLYLDSVMIDNEIATIDRLM